MLQISQEIKMRWTYFSLMAVVLQAVPVPKDTSYRTETPDHAALAHTSWVPGTTPLQSHEIR